MASHPHRINCTQCSAPFLTSHSHYYRNFNGANAFCSIECRNKFHGFTAMKDRPILICKHCGEKFKETYGRKQYCSMDCYTHTKEFTERRLAYVAAVVRESRVDVACAYCGKTITLARSHNYLRNYCNDTCKKAGRRRKV